MITIPIKPLSINKAFQGRRFKTYEYRTWERDFKLISPEFEKLDCEYYEVWATFYIKNFLGSDTNNFVKVLLDILVKLGAIKDDRYIIEEHYKKVRVKDREDERIEVIIKPYEHLTPKT